MKARGGLGRRYAADDRDSLYPMRAMLPRREPVRTFRYWSANGWWGDQGTKPFCVGYGWAHWIEDGPITHPGIPPIVSPVDIYVEAQRVDEWEGEDYEGTSVRAGAKVVKGKGLIDSYHWAQTLDDVVKCILTTGPVVVGTSWYAGMSNPVDGVVSVTGELEGGHCYLLNGVNLKSKLFRMKNSWGRGYGKLGHAWMKFIDFQRLLHEEGEACLAVERRGP